MTTRIATCECGQLRVTCSGEPTRVAACHCFACKKKSGSAFGLSAWFRETDVKAEGKAAEWTRTGDEGSRITSRFCSVCGTKLFYTNNQIQGLVGVAGGCFADLAFPVPSVSVYHESRKFPWVEIRVEALVTRG